jgi:hypothetical protein
MLLYVSVEPIVLGITSRKEIIMKDYLCLMFSVFIGCSSIAAWFTHIAHCITVEAWILLFAGAFVFPVAIVHGAGLWFGAW